MGYKFRIEYKKGAANRVADALSRRDPDAEFDGTLLTTMARPIPNVISTLREETTTLPDMVELQRTIEAGTAPPHLSMCDGLIYNKRRIYVSSHSPSKELLLFEHHSKPAAGHPGCERTFRRLAGSFFWPKISQDVRAFVAACVDCQTTKYSTQKPNGLLQPLPIPAQVWHDVSMDFITGLPSSNGYTTILVAVDRLSKYAHFASLPARFDALKVAKLFIDTVVKHHGFPKTLVSDQDPIFLSAAWKDMIRLSGTTLHFSIAYHPHSDGQTEVRNRGLEQYLRSFVVDRPNKWSTFLPWAELTLNCFHHEGLGTSPFRALYGRELPELVAATPSSSTAPTVADIIRERGALLLELRQNLARAPQRMRDTANRHRRDVNFEVGDLVLLKLQPYRQHSVARPQSAKLARLFYGPFEVSERIRPVAYRLKLPEGCKICDVFHVSLLRKFVQGADQPKAIELPPEFVDGRPITTPTVLLDRQVVMRNGQPVEEGLVQWSGEAQGAASWEPLEEIRARFPSLTLEDKGVLNRGGVDTSMPPTDQPERNEGDVEAVSSTNGDATQEYDDGSAPEIETERPRRLRRPPERWGDYVPY